MVEIISSDKLYDFREINRYIPTKKDNHKNKVYADPELTKIRRQRANLTHKILLENSTIIWYQKVPYLLKMNILIYMPN